MIRIQRSAVHGAWRPRAGRAPLPWLVALLLAALWLVALGRPAHGAPLTLLGQWEGGMDYFATGAPLAVDGPDGDTTTVDTLSQPASVVVGTADIPATATVVAAYLYWAGTVTDQQDCATNVNIDDEVVLTLPGAAVGQAITADVCHCVAGATSYDIQACRTDITPLVVLSGMQGTFTVDEFAARAANGATDNASFSLVLVYEETDLLLPRRIALYDGLEELYQSSRTMQLGGLDVDNPARGEITWYVLDGDVGGAGPEEVRVVGQPGGLSMAVSDGYNPLDNPMNRTINTTTPPQTGVIGVDIDRLDISAALTPQDSAVDMTYTTNGDKFWVVYNLVGINVYRPLIHPKTSTKTWTLQVDADGSGNVTEGDTIRYTIHLENVGTAPGYLTLTDDLPPGFASWQLVDGAGGIDQSVGAHLLLVDIWLDAGTSADVVLDAVIGPGTAGTSLVNVAVWDTGVTGTQGDVVGHAVTVASAPVDAGVPDAGGDGGVGADAGGDGGSPGDAATGADGGDGGPGFDGGGGGGGGSATPGCYCTGTGGGLNGGQGPGVAAFAWLALWWIRRRRPGRAWR